MSEDHRHSSMEDNLSLIVGASAGLGRALSLELARAGHRLVLAARDERDLRSVAADCRERFGVAVETSPLDLSDRQSVTAFLASCLARSETRTNLFLVAGAVSENDVGFVAGEEIEAIHTVNFTQPARIVSEFLKCRQRLGLATVVVMSSIAAGAPRNRNPAYASAKAALEAFCLSLKVELAKTGMKGPGFQVYRLGYVDTGLSFGQKLLLPATSPEKAARHVVNNLRADFVFAYRYFPGYWRWLVFVLKCLPWFAYKRLNF